MREVSKKSSKLTTVETQTVDQFSQLSEPSPQVVNRCITDLAVFDFVTEGPEVEREIRRSLGREGGRERLCFALLLPVNVAKRYFAATCKKTMRASCTISWRYM